MPDMKTAPSRKEVPDYIGMYEKALGDIVKECGSREQANRLLDELQKHYESTDKRLKALDREWWERPEEHAAQKAKLIAAAREEIAGIVDRHVPHISDSMKEMLMGVSLAVAALLIPATYAVSTLVVATSLVSIGGSYYIGFKMLRNWRAIAGKERISRLVGMASPRQTQAVHRQISKLSMTAKIKKR